MRARYALSLAGIVYEHREVSLKNKPKHLLLISPKGQVPVLFLSSGLVLEESLDIILWALKQTPPNSYLPSDPMELKENFEEVQLNDTIFKKALDVCKYKVRFSESEFIDAKKTCFEILQKWDKRLEKTGVFGKKTFGLLDLALLPFVRQFAGIKPDLLGELSAPYLKCWLKKQTESQIFEKIMKKFDLWEEAPLL